MNPVPRLAAEPSLAFVSYASEDAEFALKLALDLKSAGASVWLDKLELNPGQKWDRAIQSALKRCGQLTVILSPSSVESENVMDEVYYALDEGKIVVPILYLPCDIPFRLRRLQYADFRADYEKGFQSLLRTLSIAKVSAAPGRPISEDAPAPPVSGPRFQADPTFPPPKVETPAEPDPPRIPHRLLQPLAGAPASEIPVRDPPRLTNAALEPLPAPSERSLSPRNLLLGLFALALVLDLLRSAFSLLAARAFGHMASPPLYALPLAAAICSPFAGLAIDRFGTRRVVVAGLAVCSSGALLTVFHPVWLSLTLGLVGCGLSVYLPAVFARLAAIGGAHRGVANAAIGQIPTLLVFLATPLFAVYSIEGYRPWYIELAILAGLLCAAWLLLDRSTPNSGHSASRSFIWSATAVAAFAAYAGCSWCLGSINNLSLKWGSPEGERSLGMGLAIVTVASALLFGWVADRVAHRKRFVVAGLLVASPIAGIPFAIRAGPDYAALILYLASAGIGCAIPNLWALIQTAAPRKILGLCGGLVSFSGAIAIFFASRTYYSYGLQSMPCMLTGLMAALSAVIAWRFLHPEGTA